MKIDSNELVWACLLGSSNFNWPFEYMMPVGLLLAWTRLSPMLCGLSCQTWCNWYRIVYSSFLCFF